MSNDDRGLAAIEKVIVYTAEQIEYHHNPKVGGHSSASVMADTLRKLVEIRGVYLAGAHPIAGTEE